MRVLLFFLALPFLCISQSTQDSLHKIGDEYLAKAKAVYFTDIDSSLVYLKTALPYLEASGHWDAYVNCYNGLFNINYKLRNLEKAEKYAQLALTLGKKYLKPNDLALLRAQNNLGVYYQYRGAYDQALAVHKDVLKSKQQAKVDKETIEKTLANLSNIYALKGDFDEAIRYQTQGLNILLDTFGLYYPRTAENLYTLALRYHSKEELEKSINTIEQCLEVLDSFPDKVFSHRTRIKSYQTLSSIYLKQQQPEKSYQFLQKALQLQKDKPYRVYNSQDLLGHYYLQKKNINKQKVPLLLPKKP